MCESVGSVRMLCLIYWSLGCHLCLWSRMMTWVIKSCPMTWRPCACPLTGGCEWESSAGVHSEGGPRPGGHSGHIGHSQHSSHRFLPRWSTYKLCMFTLFSLALAGLFWDRTFTYTFLGLVCVFWGGRYSIKSVIVSSIFLSRTLLINELRFFIVSILKSFRRASSAKVACAFIKVRHSFLKALWCKH